MIPQNYSKNNFGVSTSHFPLSSIDNIYRIIPYGFKLISSLLLKHIESTDNLFYEFHKISPSSYCTVYSYKIFYNFFVVYTGGQIFDLYLSTHISVEDFSLLRATSKNFITGISLQTQERILQNYSSSFKFWISYCFYCQSQKTNNLLLEYIMDLNNKGLSHKGIELLCEIGLSPSLTTFKKYIKKSIKEQHQIVYSKLKEPNRIFWIDNFSKFMKYSRIRQNGSAESLRWTAMGMIEFPSKDINLFRRENLDKPLLPKNPFKYFEEQDLNYLYNCGFELQIEYYFKKNNLYTIPPSVKKDDRKKFKFYPITLDSNDIGSNKGLHEIMKNLTVDYFTLEHFNILLVDQNIFWRLSKK